MKDEVKRKARPVVPTRSSSVAPPSTVRQLQDSEFDFISRIKRRAEAARARKADGLVQGIGDDAAVLIGRGGGRGGGRSGGRSGRDSVVTADLLVEDVDFRRTARPHDIGYKALAVSLSDIAAMGARPRWTLLSLGLPQDIWDSPFAQNIYEGFLAAAREFDVTLIGGDVSRTPERIVIDSIVIGETRRGRAVLRSGARAGDQIFVTGTLGAAAGGLRLLEHANGLRTRAARTRLLSGLAGLARRQAHPTPRVACGALLGERRLASAMIDLSDGLSSDLAHLCERSGVGALVEASSLPVAPLLKQSDAAGSNSFTRALQADALDLALHGGEDFELLFTTRPRIAARLPKRLGGVPLTRIGEVRAASEGIKLVRDGRAGILRPSGFDHFKQAR
ncbi:MAG TPA: thiamine-phosphate kinase [Pyrinomonadaceae bacterium]|jgi:thiamine-monophosphate kinase|nr:thiamine-phosphate kinase [Pyrinomonadaceae bacterium]